MDSIRSLLGDTTLQNIADKAGKDVTKTQVENVLNAILPTIEKERASGELATRAAAAEEQSGTRAGGLDALSLLLGGNSGAATQSAADSAGVSSGTANSILKIAAPLLLILLLKNSLGGNSNQGGGLLGSLLGGGLLGGSSQPAAQPQTGGSLLGSLLGGSAQPAQQPQQTGTGNPLLDALLGGGSAAPSTGGGLLGSLLGDSTPEEPVQPVELQQSGGSSLLGGEGGVERTFLGALVLTVISNIMNIAGIASEWQNLVFGVIILLIGGLDYSRHHRS